MVQPRPAADPTTDRILCYYRMVDAGDVTGLVDLFDADATYHRPGYAPLRGRSDLRRFYDEERAIEHGVHEVATVLVSGSGAAVHGTFEGVLRDGTAVSLRFADFFVLTPELRFARRDTFFFAPLV